MTGESVNPSQPTNRDTDSTGDAAVSDDVSRVLENRHRRYVLYCLKTSETPMALADLADDLVRWETDASPAAVQDVREKVYLSLYHCHLPKLANVGLVDFDADRNLVDLREDADGVPLGGDRPRADELFEASPHDNAR